jgi:hypothetical protein
MMEKKENFAKSSYNILRARVDTFPKGLKGGLMKKRLLPVLMIPLLVLVFSLWAAAEMAHGKPKLVLQITIDQTRGDYPMRYKDRLGEGGFRYLMEKGIHYINAHYQHADTETPIGHAALFTGTYPAHNGIVAGNWFDMDKERIIYNCEDDRYPIIGKEPAKGEGRAPTNLLSSTSR